ncbi:unnamed protein product, partial [Phaeothamnion confervicola]
MAKRNASPECHTTFQRCETKTLEDLMGPLVLQNRNASLEEIQTRLDECGTELRELDSWREREKASAFIQGVKQLTVQGTATAQELDLPHQPWRIDLAKHICPRAADEMEQENKAWRKRKLSEGHVDLEGMARGEARRCNAIAESVIKEGSAGPTETIHRTSNRQGRFTTSAQNLERT